MPSLIRCLTNHQSTPFILIPCQVPISLLVSILKLQRNVVPWPPLAYCMSGILLPRLRSFIASFLIACMSWPWLFGIIIPSLCWPFVQLLHGRYGQKYGWCYKLFTPNTAFIAGLTTVLRAECSPNIKLTKHCNQTKEPNWLFMVLSG